MLIPIIENSLNPSNFEHSSKGQFRTFAFCSLVAMFILFILFQAIGSSFIQDKLVQPEPDGSLNLSAEKGKAIGPDIKYMPEWKAFGWFTAEDRVEWDVDVTKGGKYDVFLEWSVSDEEAGKPFIFEAGDQQLEKKVGKTGSWETFKSVKIGRIQLPAGQQKMVFRPGSDFEEGALLDLRAVRLVPVK
jgi:hypothetical protein